MKDMVEFKWQAPKASTNIVMGLSYAVQFMDQVFDKKAPKISLDALPIGWFPIHLDKNKTFSDFVFVKRAKR